MKNLMIRGVAAAATAGVALAALSAGPANADTFIPLPGGRTVEPIGKGTITVTLTGEHALLSPPMVSLPTSRNAWVSGHLNVLIAGNNPGNGSIQAGYVVGCQIAVGKANIGLTGSASSGLSASYKGGAVSTAFDPSAKGGDSGALKLSAGGIGIEPLTLDKPTVQTPGAPFKPEVPSDQGWEKPGKAFAFQGDSGVLVYNDTTIGVDDCAGYAQARFYAYVTGEVGNTEGTVVLWGEPFTLG